MADTFSNDLRLRLQESGSNAGTWGDLLNGTITNIASGFGQGSEAIPNASTHTITLADGTADEARSLYLKCTGGGQACTVTLGPNTISKVWIIDNTTSYTLTFRQGSGATVAIAAGAVKVIATDGAGSGAAVVDTLDGLEGSLKTLAVNSGATTETTAATIGYNGDAGTNLYINTDHGSNLVSLYASGSASKTMRFLSGTLEVMRLGTTGSVGIGNSSPSSYFSNARNLVVGGTTGANGMTIVGSTDTQIFFADGTSGADAYRGIIRYSHADNGFSFWTDATQRLRITSAGAVELTGPGGAGETFLNFTADSNTTKAQISAAKAGASGGRLVFSTNNSSGTLTESMRIDGATGKVGIGGVGNISPYGIRFAINGTGSGGAGLYFGSGVILPTDNTPTISDANVDLGASNYRFKDLRLSGKAYMTGLEPGQVTITQGSYFIGNTAAGYRFNNAADTVNLMILKDNGDLSVGTSGSGHRLFLANAINATQSNAQFRILGSGYSAFHFLDANAYYIGQNSNIRSFRLYSGTNTGVGAQLSAGATSFGTFSDERLKENIEPIENALTSLSRLQTVKYHLKDVDSAESKKRLGLIAQDLVGVLDEVIEPITRAEDDTEYMAVRYTEIIPVLVKAMQEQQATIESQAAAITDLTTRLKILENN